MGWWAAAGDWSAKAVDQFLGQDQAHKANRTNIRLAKENRDFLERMSNTEVTRHVADLRNAGLNPMLGYTGQASTPSVSPARVEPTYRSGGEASKPDLMAMAMMQSQRRLIDAQARSTNADASIKEADVPYSGKAAELRFESLFDQAEVIRNELKKSDISAMNEAERQSLALEAQKLANMAERLGMTEREAAAKFFEDAGAAAKWLQLLKIVSDLKR